MQDALQASVEAIRSIETAGKGFYIFHKWQPEAVGMQDSVYVPPVAYETVVSALMGSNLPARILIHGPSGNGKSRLLRQLCQSVSTQVGSSGSHLNTLWSSISSLLNFK